MKYAKNGIKKMIGIGLVFGLMMAMTACGKTSGELPSNEPGNTGCYAVMETENGYYTNFGIRKYLDRENVSGTEFIRPQYLCYHDKTGCDTILLCDKAECEHNGGDDCVATYKQISVINSVLYQDAIYIYCTEENDGIIEFNLYKAALDGSAMDKVGTVFSVENTADKGFKGQPLDLNEFYFIIHKGEAYLPYYARLGKTSSGFMGAGVVKMNLQTGASKTIFETKDINSSMVTVSFAAGDYVYMDAGYGYLWSRYSIKEDKMVPISAAAGSANNAVNCTAKDGDCRHPRAVSLATKQYLLEIGYEMVLSEDGKVDIDESQVVVNAYEADTGCYIPEKRFVTDILPEDFDLYHVYLTYQDMAVIAVADKVLFYGLDEENWGQKLGEVSYEFEGREVMRAYMNNVIFKVTNDKLYQLTKPIDVPFNGVWDNELQADVLWYDVYSCPVADILEGTGEWSFAYSYDPGKK